MILADTGFLIALLKPRDDLHSRALAWSAFVPDKLIVTEYVLCEAVNACTKGVPRSKLHGLVTRVRSHSDYLWLPASPDLLDAGLRLHAGRPDKGWSLTDCVSFEAMRARGLTRALAHDHHFEQAGFDPLLRRDPPA